MRKSLEIIRKLTTCRVCKSNNLTKVMAFGPTPLANAFLSHEQINLPEAFYPLDLYYCKNCSFLQLGHVVSPEIMFGNYVYVSSTSPVFIQHFNDFAHYIFQRFKLYNTSLIIDIGSNDGILLKPFKKLGANILGIEPAKHIAKVAVNDGIETIPEFFSVELAKKIVKKKGKAKIVTATNVFAHIDNLDEVINGLKVLLADDGMFIMEAPYLIDFIRKRYFDLVYHEHLSYWAVSPLITLFRRFKMVVFDIQKVNVHGGSIRVFIKKDNGPYRTEKRVKEFLALEKVTMLAGENTYISYAKKILENRVLLITLLTKLKLQGKKIIGYGAPAKGNTLLNYFKIGEELLEYIIDDSPFKQGLYTPGTHIPVVAPSKLNNDDPDYMLILAWNFAQSIIEKNAFFRNNGGKFIVPSPRPKII